MQRSNYGYRNRRRQQDGEDHILPLINIVFLLLSFFLIAGQIEKRSPIPLTEPQSVSDRDDDTSLSTLQVDQEGRLLLDGLPTTPETLSALHGQTGQDRPLRVHADAAVSAQRVLEILVELRDAGWEKVTLVTVRPSS